MWYNILLRTENDNERWSMGTGNANSNEESVNISKEMRDFKLDALRITACFMVVLLHVAAHLYINKPINSFQWSTYNFYTSCVRSSVPLFIMISGVFFLSPKKEITNRQLYLKYILRLALIYFIWSFVYTLYNIYAETAPSDIKNIIKSIIQGPYHFWYIPVIAGLYVISPILKRITKTIDDSAVKYFIIVFSAACIVKTVSAIPILPYYNTVNLICGIIPTELVCQYFGYFLLGYYLYNTDISLRSRKILYISGIASVVLCAVLTFYIMSSEKKRLWIYTIIFQFLHFWKHQHFLFFSKI